MQSVSVGALKSGCLRNTHGAQGIRVFHPSLDATGGGRGVVKILTFQEYARRSRNTHVFIAFESSGRRVGAIWGLENSRCMKKTRAARGTRVLRSDLDSDMSEIGALEIWVPQKYARRSRNTLFSSLPGCNWRRPRGGQNLDIPGISAAHEEYACFHCV